MKSGEDDRSATVAAVMRARFVALSPEDSLREAEALMRMGRFRALPVVSADELVGMLHYAPLVRSCVAGQRPGEVNVASLMDAKPSCTTPDASLSAAAEGVAASTAGCVPVVDDARRLLGIVTESDLLRAAYPGPSALRSY